LPQPRSPTTPVEIDRDLIAQLRPEAAARHTSVPRLIHDILNVIATEGLTKAVRDETENSGFSNFAAPVSKLRRDSDFQSPLLGFALA
jgi:hypothetical protein